MNQTGLGDAAGHGGGDGGAALLAAVAHLAVLVHRYHLRVAAAPGDLPAEPSGIKVTVRVMGLGHLSLRVNSLLLRVKPVAVCPSGMVSPGVSATGGVLSPAGSVSDGLASGVGGHAFHRRGVVRRAVHVALGHQGPDDGDDDDDRRHDQGQGDHRADDLQR